MQHPELARQLLQQMDALQLPVSTAQLDVPYEIERRPLTLTLTLTLTLDLTREP